jgi:hypothetical protein
MKRFGLFLGTVGFALLGAACSSGDEAPPAFSTDTSLEARLSADFGAPFVIERRGEVAQVVSPLATTKVIATEPEAARAAAEKLFTNYASDFGVPSSRLLFRVEPAVLDSSDDQATSVNLAQLLPGTDIEIWQRGASLSLAADGTLVDAMAALEDPAEAPRATSRTVAEARAAIVSIAESMAPGVRPAFVQEPKLYAVVSGRGLVLRYRATFSLGSYGFQTWLDAESLAAVDVGPATFGAVGTETVYAWPSAGYPVMRAITVPGTIVPVMREISVQKDTGPANPTFTLLRVAEPALARVETLEQESAGQSRMPNTKPFVSPDPSEYLGQNPLTVSSGNVTWGPGVAVDVHYNALAVDKVFGSVFKTASLPRMVGVVHANDGFRKSGPGGAWQYGEKMAQFSPSYDPIADIVRFGDGGFDKDDGVFYLPTGIPLDIAAHEWAHALVSRKQSIGYLGEEGMVQEVIADAIGTLVAMEVEHKSPLGIGERGRLDGKFMRNFQRTVLSEEVTPRGRMARPSRADDIDWECMENRLDVDQGCVHFNSGPGNHAFYLMTHGGRAVGGTEFVRKMSLADAKEVWIGLLAKGQLFGGKIGLMTVFALAQVDGAKKFIGAAAERSVACAWSGVGFLSHAQLVARGISCTEETEGSAIAPASDCGGKSDGYYCSPTTSFGAILCHNGGIAGGAQCVSGQRCVANADGSAVIGEDGLPLCESETP